jgi:hypothetical protein
MEKSLEQFTLEEKIDNLVAMRYHLDKEIARLRGQKPPRKPRKTKVKVEPPVKLPAKAASLEDQPFQVRLVRETGKLYKGFVVERKFAFYWVSTLGEIKKGYNSFITGEDPNFSFFDLEDTVLNESLTATFLATGDVDIGQMKYL